MTWGPHSADKPSQILYLPGRVALAPSGLCAVLWCIIKTSEREDSVPLKSFHGMFDSVVSQQ